MTHEVPVSVVRNEIGKIQPAQRTHISVQMCHYFWSSAPLWRVVLGRLILITRPKISSRPLNLVGKTIGSKETEKIPPANSGKTQRKQKRERTTGLEPAAFGGRRSEEPKSNALPLRHVLRKFRILKKRQIDRPYTLLM